MEQRVRGGDAESRVVKVNEPLPFRHGRLDVGLRPARVASLSEQDCPLAGDEAPRVPGILAQVRVNEARGLTIPVEVEQCHGLPVAP